MIKQFNDQLLQLEAIEGDAVKEAEKDARSCGSASLGFRRPGKSRPFEGILAASRTTSRRISNWRADSPSGYVVHA